MFGARTDRGFEEIARQLDEYLAGERSTFDLPVRHAAPSSSAACGT